jgi:hypothetical protein
VREPIEDVLEGAAASVDCHHEVHVGFDADGV